MIRVYLVPASDRRRPARTLAGLLGLLAAVSGSCSGPPRHDSLADEGRALFSQPSTPAPPERASRSWTILLRAFYGEGRDQAAQQALQAVRDRGRLPDAFIERRRQLTMIVVGRYASRDSADALRDLERIRSMEIDGSRPYASARFLPPVGSDRAGPLEEYDLANAKRIHGSWALYTLQIGVYSREDRPPNASELREIRQAAEQAAIALRADGELAFFAHGPHRSMVTVGLFGEDDFDPTNPAIQSPDLLETRRRHPHNLLNGRIMRVKVGNRWIDAPSRLVVVPDS